MLNWIWLGLIVIAIVVAGSRDITELSSNRFRNGNPLEIHTATITEVAPGTATVSGYILRSDFIAHYGEAPPVTDTLPVAIETSPSGAIIHLHDSTPALWKDIAAAQGEEKQIAGTASISEDRRMVLFTPNPVRFRILAKVTDSLVSAVETAVTLALGLIGIMALWLGIMKIAEAAGFVTLLARMARPIMVRLFPEVPAEHPAMGAMLSNMAANFLGLSNAATPLGLKAMEELNKLNPVSGTATNAMCMFLTINTSAITLIPATVIAVRASLGSQDPTDIIVPTLLATVVALTCGVFFNRFIQRFFPVKPVEVKGEAA